MQRCLFRIAIVLSMSCAMLISHANAERYVFESYEANRPREAGAVMQMLRQQMSNTDFVSDPQLLTKKLAAHLFRPGVTDAAYDAERFEADVRAGMTAWSEADFGKAGDLLARAVQRCRANPMTLIRETKARSTMLRALLRLGLASRRQAAELLRQLPKASDREQVKINQRIRTVTERHDAAFAEIVRSYGRNAVTLDEFGAEAADQFHEAVSALTRKGVGQLLVTASDATLTLYLNEQLESNLLGHVRANLAPGIYRVLAQARNRETREYTVEVTENGLAYLDIQVAADGALATGEWVGFSDIASTGATEGVLATELLKLDLQQSEVVLIRVTPKKSAVIVVGAKYEVSTSRLICRGVVELDNAVLVTKTNGDRLRQLVTFLRGRGDDELHAVIVEQDTRTRAAAGVSEPGSEPRQLVAAQPVVAVVPDRPRVANPASRDASSSLGPKLLVAGGVALMVGGGVLFAIDEDDNPGSGPVQPTYRDTALPGVIALSAGAVITGVGLWLWLRDDGSSHNATASRRRALPLVAVDHDQVFLGWHGAF